MKNPESLPQSEVWLLWITRSADWPIPENTVLDGVYSSGPKCENRIKDLIKNDPYVKSYKYRKEEVK